MLRDKLLHGIEKVHTKKVKNLHKQQQINQSSNEKVNNYIKSTVQLSSYQLSDDEITAFSYGLYHHIPNKLNCHRIHTEFEQLHQNLVKDISHIPDDNFTRLKTKLRSTCERHSRIHVSHKYKTIVDSLSKNQSICIMKQDKERGVVVMDRSKCENKIQRELRTLKTRLTIQKYRHLYLPGSNPGRFYGTAKLHKLPQPPYPPNSTIEELPIRSIVSNTSTASYPLGKYLAQNLSPLGQSSYTIKRAFDLMGTIRK